MSPNMIIIGSKNKKTANVVLYSHDIHKEVCVEAHNLFTSDGYHSELYIENGLEHTYNKSCERYILNFFGK